MSGNLTDNPNAAWVVNGVNSVLQTDAVEGQAEGASHGGIGNSNAGAQVLANRTAYLYGQQNTDKANISTLQTQLSQVLSAFPTYFLASLTSSGQWTAPTVLGVATYTVKVTVTGGGGGGASCGGAAPGGDYASGAGGGAGATVIGYMTVTGGGSYQVTVGAGGAAQGNGGASSFANQTGRNTYAYAAGGLGANFTNATQSAGAGTGSGSATYSPFAGAIIIPGPGQDGQGGAFSGVAGQGAASLWGAGSRGSTVQLSAVGAPGSGGGGTYGATAASGSPGAGGIVVIEGWV